MPPMLGRRQVRLASLWKRPSESRSSVARITCIWRRAAEQESDWPDQPLLPHRQRESRQRTMRLHTSSHHRCLMRWSRRSKEPHAAFLGKEWTWFPGSLALPVPHRSRCEAGSLRQEGGNRMSGNSAIEWTHMTWNPLAGCTRVTAGCDHCFAFALDDSRHTIYQRNAGWWSPGGSPMPAQYGRPFSAIQLLPDRLMQPLREKKPKMIFVNSMSDLFHSQVSEDYIRRVFAVMQEESWHTFQVLTKRAGRLRYLGPRLDWPSNVWVGVSIEQDSLLGRTNALRAVPAAVRFISPE